VWSGSEKRREWLHEAIDFIRVFVYFGLPKTAPKKAKIRATLIEMFHPFFFPQKAPNSSSVSLQKGARLRGGLYWKGY
jgi:hypothetical protein